MVAVDRGEPVDLTWTFGVRRVQRWRHGLPAGWQCVHVAVGTLPDGRWFAERTGLGGGARAYATEVQARQVARQLMAERGDGWVEVSDPAGPS